MRQNVRGKKTGDGKRQQCKKEQFRVHDSEFCILHYFSETDIIIIIIGS